jgi:hypothetical protein
VPALFTDSYFLETYQFKSEASNIFVYKIKNDEEETADMSCGELSLLDNRQLPFPRLSWITELPDTEIRSGMLSELFYAPVSRDKVSRITRNTARVS